MHVLFLLFLVIFLVFLLIFVCFLSIAFFSSSLIALVSSFSVLVIPRGRSIFGLFFIVLLPFLLHFRVLSFSCLLHFFLPHNSRFFRLPLRHATRQEYVRFLLFLVIFLSFFFIFVFFLSHDFLSPAHIVFASSGTLLGMQ